MFWGRPVRVICRWQACVGTVPPRQRPVPRPKA